jgi:hypothetical protein
MKKFFLFAAAAIAALTVSAQTIDFPELIAQGDFGATRTFEKDGVSLVVNNGKGKFAVDANKAKFGTVESFVQDSMRLKTGGASGSESSMVLNVPTNGKVYVHARTSSAKVARTLVLSQGGLDILNANLLDADAVETTIEGESGPETVKIFPVFSCNVKKGAIDITYGAVGEGSTAEEADIKAGGVNIYAIIFESSTEGIENAAAAVKAEKSFRNGQLIIRKNGVEYNALGAQL